MDNEVARTSGPSEPVVTFASTRPVGLATFRVSALALAVVVLVVGAVGLLAAIAVGPAASSVAPTTESPSANAPTQIGSCTTITDPGEYVLSGDLSDADAETCISVRADGVLLDGANHTIDGGSVGQVSSGVAVEPGTANVTVRNLRVSQWAFGVRFSGVSGGEIRNVEARFNADGVRVEESGGVGVRSVVAEHNFVGVGVARSENVTVTDTTARWNGVYGVSVVEATDVALSNVTAARDELGFGFFEVTDVTIRNVTAVSNQRTGFELVSVTDARVSNLTVRANADEPYVRTPRGFVAVDAADVELSETRDTRVENVTTGRNWSVVLGSNSVNDSVAVRTDAGSVSVSGSGVVVSSVASPPEPPADRESLGPAVRAETTAANATLTLSMTYSETALAASNVAESTLRLWRYDGDAGPDDADGGDDAGPPNDGSWSPVEEAEADPDWNLARATVGDSTVLALLGEHVGDAADRTQRPDSANESGPVSVTEKVGVRIEFACDSVWVSVPDGVTYSLIVHYFDAETETYGRGLLGPLSGTTEEPFDSEIVFTEVDVLVGGRVVVSGFIPDECPNAP